MENQNKAEIIIKFDYIQVLDDGIEVALWTREQWVKNPDLVVKIARCIKLFASNPELL
jgi:hypothetical protein